MTASRPPRRLVAVAALALVLAGCSQTNPIQTDRPYAPADGVQVTVGDLRVENLLAVTTGADEPGALSGAVVNSGSGEVEVTFTAGDSSAVLQVPAGGSVLFGTGNDTGETVLVDSVAAAPGALIDVTIASDRDGSVTAQVPVLDGNEPPYDAVLAG